jgi:hypothetical protein
MNNMDEEQFTIGFIDIPVTYWNMTQEDKDKMCNKIIRVLIKKLDEDLNPEINRIAALDDIMESSILSNELEENYEICEVFKNIRKILNEA